MGDTSTADTSTTSLSDSTETVGTAGASSTTGAPLCDDDPSCDPEFEDVHNCPEQCNECGDGVVFGRETCDNGSNVDASYNPEQVAGACAPGCEAVGHCGDMQTNGPEDCDPGEESADCDANCTVSACGDGEKNASAGEQCDDENTIDGDGCSDDCKSERWVFVTSTTHTGDSFGGVAGADTECNQLGMDLDGGPFKAWLSDDVASPAERFDTAFTGLYRLRAAGFPVVAQGWAGLIDGSIDHLIDAHENGTTVVDSVNVWTNTDYSGQRVTSDPCSFDDGGVWQNPTGGSTIGQSSGVLANPDDWTNVKVNQICNEPRRIYCFQDP